MLIVEGADNLGKTTFCNKAVEIAKKRGMPSSYKHMGRPGPDFTFGAEYFSMIEKYAVQDRFHIGSIVWHDNVMTSTKLSVIDGKIRSCGGLIVFFVSFDEAWYFERLKLSKKKELFEPEQLIEANRKYYSLAGRYADVVVPVGPSEYPGPEFPSDQTIEDIVTEWENRLLFAGGM